MRATRSMHTCAIFWPVSTEPVNATQSTRGSSTMRAPTSPPPGTMFTTPGGSASKQSASASVESGVSSDGLHTHALPAASAGASFQESSSSG